MMRRNGRMVNRQQNKSRAEPGKSPNPDSIRRRERKALQRQFKQFPQIQHHDPLDLNFTVTAHTRLHKLKDWMQKLQKVSKHPNPGIPYEINLDNLIHGSGDLRHSRGECRQNFQKRVENMTRNQSIIIIGTEEELREKVESGFTVPIYIPRECEYGKSLCRPGAFTSITQYIDALNPDKQVMVNDLDAPIRLTGGGKTFYETPSFSVKQVRKAFNGGHRINCLEMDVDYSCNHEPGILAEMDWFRKPVQDQIARGEIQGGKAVSRWFLLSRENAISEIHVDGGAPITWVHGLVGAKLWFWGQGITQMSRLDFSRYLQQKETLAFERDWACLLLRQGDTFIMPSSMEHSVYSSEDCLFVGGFVLTNKAIPESLICLPLIEQNPSITNDDAPKQLFKVYENYYRSHLLGTRRSLEDLERFKSALDEFLRFEIAQATDDWTSSWQKFVLLVKEEKWSEKLNEMIKNSS